MHQRTAIKKKFEELLTGNTSLGNNVKLGRRRNVSEDCISIYSDSESSEVFSQWPLQYKRVAKVDIEIFIITEEYEGDEADYKADEVSKEVETVINSALPSLDGLAESVYLSESEILSNVDSVKLITSIKLSYVVTYISMENLTVDEMNFVKPGEVENFDAFNGEINTEDIVSKIESNFNI